MVCGQSEPSLFLILCCLSTNIRLSQICDRISQNNDVPYQMIHIIIQYCDMCHNIITLSVTIRSPRGSYWSPRGPSKCSSGTHLHMSVRPRGVWPENFHQRLAVRFEQQSSLLREMGLCCYIIKHQPIHTANIPLCNNGIQHTAKCDLVSHPTEAQLRKFFLFLWNIFRALGSEQQCMMRSFK